MGVFEFKKWFFDVSVGTDDYLILFVSRIKLGKNHFSYFQMHAAKREPGGVYQPYNSCVKTLHQGENDRNGVIFKEGSIRFEKAGCEIHLDFGNDRVNLAYNSHSIHWPDHSILYNPGKKNLDWIPLILRGLVSGHVCSAGRVTTYRDSLGYCDEVRSGFIPWRLPFSQLFWGRLHHEQINLSFSVLLGNRSALAVSGLYLEFNGVYFVLNGLQIEIRNREKSNLINLTYADTYIIRGYSDEITIAIEVYDHKELIMNDFMDYTPEYGTIATGILRRISRDPRGIKFFASADIMIQVNEKINTFENVTLVDEYVEFR